MDGAPSGVGGCALASVLLTAGTVAALIAYGCSSHAAAANLAAQQLLAKVEENSKAPWIFFAMAMVMSI